MEEYSTIHGCGKKDHAKKAKQTSRGENAAVRIASYLFVPRCWRCLLWE